MKINLLNVYKYTKTAIKIYGAYRDYRQMRKYGFKTGPALEAAAAEAGLDVADLFDHVVKKAPGDLADLTKNDLATTIYGTDDTF
jgi:hypothetical protein